MAHGLHMLGLILSPAPALDGESAGGSSTGLAAISLASMVFGWLLIAGLWFFVFSARARAKREKDPPS
jgi:hypothetical protein